MSNKKNEEQEKARAVIRRFYELFYETTPVDLSHIPAEMVVNERTYEVLSFVPSEDGKRATDGRFMSRCAKEMDADGDEHHLGFLLDNQADIPTVFQEITFLFPETARWGGEEAGVIFDTLTYNRTKGEWVKFLDWRDYHGWGDRNRLIREKEKMRK